MQFRKQIYLRNQSEGVDIGLNKWLSKNKIKSFFLNEALINFVLFETYYTYICHV